MTLGEGRLDLSLSLAYPCTDGKRCGMGRRHVAWQIATFWRCRMAITLNHTIVPAHDKEASARFFAQIFGLTYEGPVGHFAPVRVNETLTLDFDNRDRFESHHYTFKAPEDDFDAIFGRVQAEGIPYWSGPYSLEDRKINQRGGGRGV